MKSIYDFIVKPLGEKYNNKINIKNKELYLNTKIEGWKFVNRLAIVVETPLAFDIGIKKGDTVVIHQNVFRTFYNSKGVKKKSRSFFKEDLYFCALDQIYLYKNNSTWKPVGDRCFVMPIVNNDQFSNKKEKDLIGVLKYDNSSLNSLEITSGDLVGYTPNSEWEFLIEGQRLYCMKSNDIVIKYEYQGNEKEYNPSWARSG
ncbi:MAG: hypothetical protein CMJ25_18815 [Phycisphaerae bacterium]|nr:hypothetical protein [Phycisphaerae bacterium]|tara:strand:- start:160 stop:765 length:606 start_codon:yes stop_codon:yes gene_type:complete